MRQAAQGDLVLELLNRFSQCTDTFFYCQKYNATATVSAVSPGKPLEVIFYAQARSTLAHGPGNCCYS